jgi:hypothetical protein
MDHIMRYPILKAQSPSPARAALLTAAALALFTLASGLVGSGPLAFAEGQARPSHTVPTTATRAGATAEPAGSVLENAMREVLAAPAPSPDAGRAQNPPKSKTLKRTRNSAAATAASGPEAHPVTAELSSSHRPESCPFIKCSIICPNGLGNTLYFPNVLSCYSYSDSAGCHATGLFTCSDRPDGPSC